MQSWIEATRPCWVFLIQPLQNDLDDWKSTNSYCFFCVCLTLFLRKHPILFHVCFPKASSRFDWSTKDPPNDWQLPIATSGKCNLTRKKNHSDSVGPRYSDVCSWFLFFFNIVSCGLRWHLWKCHVIMVTLTISNKVSKQPLSLCPVGVNFETKMQQCDTDVTDNNKS